MKDFLEKLPPLLAALSKAFLVALIEQVGEVADAIWRFFTFLGRLVLELAKLLWEIYCRVEAQILGVIVDLGLAVVALRYFFLLLGIGIVLAYFKWWIILIVYVSVLSIAIFRFFQIDSKTLKQETDNHKQSRDTYVRLLRWPLRALASLVLLYASWYFFGWHPLNVLWRHNPSTEVSKAEEEAPQNESAEMENKRTKMERTEKKREDGQQSNQSQKSKTPLPVQTATRRPSFDCAKATSASESLVCSSPDLVLLDLSLADEYKNATARTDSSGKALLRSKQNEWLRHVREKCQNVECLRSVYETRIGELKAVGINNQITEQPAQLRTSRGIRARDNVPCSNELQTRSIEGEYQTDYTVTNRTNVTLTVYWLNYQGERKKWFDVPSGQTQLQTGAYTNHPWVVADPSGRCRRIFYAPAKIVIE